jgi:hypothetical protein
MILSIILQGYFDKKLFIIFLIYYNKLNFKIKIVLNILKFLIILKLLFFLYNYKIQFF